MPRLSRFRPLLSLPLVIALVVFASRAVSGTPVRRGLPSPFAVPVVHAELVNMPTIGRRRMPAISLDSLVGRSGDLRVRIMEADETASYPGLGRQYGDEARRAGIRPMDGVSEVPFTFVTMASWRQKLGSHINGYHVGYWPGEGRRAAAGYENPAGFIEVTRDNVDTQLSTHFRLRDFVTHDQGWVWPKYVVLREDLLDKLELVLDALQEAGVETRHVVVLSGFRSPQYNTRGVGEGMARSSRHQFGDAADIIVDANGDGRMDDLDMDGRVTFADLRVLDRAVQRIEQRYPELVGGLGLYHETGPSGPFAHIDVRGTRARWTNAQRRGPSLASARGAAPAAVAQASGRCRADGAMAVLCGGVE
ncbi:MAG: hypothetical protein IT361_03415 [Gemmatimonadaceae bacterium]|nr:hypothetical protein [Gemmatimonadaceae bacterium]